MSNLKENAPPTVHAFDGVGGSGKSHVIRGVQRALAEEGFTSAVYKISGLGDSSRVKQLKSINDCREQLLAGNEAPEKILADKRSDRIFRLASRYQTRLFEKERGSFVQDSIFLDRTPMLHWVYSSSVDPENPFLQEMHDEGISLTNRLGLTRGFFLKVTPSTAFARLIARGVATESSVQEQNRKITELSLAVGASKEEMSAIHEKTRKLLSDGKIDPKPFVRWDFIPYSVMQNECVRYEQAISDMEKLLGIPFTIVDAEEPVDYVISTVRNVMRSTVK